VLARKNTAKPRAKTVGIVIFAQGKLVKEARFGGCPNTNGAAIGKGEVENWPVVGLTTDHPEESDVNSTSPVL
jgi:hypothetical protein